MPLEDLSGNKYINSLNEQWPLGTDLLSAGDDHIRGIKNILKKSFPSSNQPLTRSIDSLNIGSVPMGAIITFYAATAPTGWVRQSVNNVFMLRIISSADGSGGSGGGTDDPTYNAKVPSHTHNLSGNTGDHNTDHTHYVSGNTTAQSVLHTHHVEGPTTTENTHHTHTVNITGQTGAGLSATGNNFYWGAAQSTTVTLTGSGTTSVNDPLHYHGFTADTGGESVSHVHGVGLTTTGANTGHSHPVYGTADVNAGASIWAPRYLNFILCVRNYQ